MYFSRVLDNLASNAMERDQEPDIETAFRKFAVVTKELSALMKTLVSLQALLLALKLKKISTIIFVANGSETYYFLFLI